MLNGVGLRNVYFFTGCTHGCPECFNAIVADPDYEPAEEWTEEKMNELLEDVKKPYISGITLSGGDPMSRWNREGILELVREFKEKITGKTIWLYTGYTWEYLMSLSPEDPRRQILQYIDVLCDGPFIKDLKSPKKPWVGSENQRVIDVPKSLKEQDIVLI